MSSKKTLGSWKLFSLVQIIVNRLFADDDAGRCRGSQIRSFDSRFLMRSELAALVMNNMQPLDLQGCTRVDNTMTRSHYDGVLMERMSLYGSWFYWVCEWYGSQMILFHSRWFQMPWKEQTYIGLESTPITHYFWSSPSPSPVIKPTRINPCPREYTLSIFGCILYNRF